MLLQRGCNKSRQLRVAILARWGKKSDGMAEHCPQPARVRATARKRTCAKALPRRRRPSLLVSTQTDASASRRLDTRTRTRGLCLQPSAERLERLATGTGSEPLARRKKPARPRQQPAAAVVRDCGRAPVSGSGVQPASQRCGAMKLYSLSVLYKGDPRAVLLKAAYDVSSFSFFQRSR